MNTRIRLADRSSDARAIAGVHVASWQSAYRGLLPGRYLAGLDIDHLTGHWHRKLARPPHHPAAGHDDLWVIEADRTVSPGGAHRPDVVGFALLGPCRNDASLAGFAGEVIMLYVHPDHTGHGLGRALLDHAFAVLTDRGYRWLVIWVLQHNERARVFYQKMGLRPDGAMRWDRFAGDRVPVLRYAMPLAPAIDFGGLFSGA